MIFSPLNGFFFFKEERDQRSDWKRRHFSRWARLFRTENSASMTTWRQSFRTLWQTIILREQNDSLCTGRLAEWKANFTEDSNGIRQNVEFSIEHRICYLAPRVYCVGRTSYLLASDWFKCRPVYRDVILAVTGSGGGLFWQRMELWRHGMIVEPRWNTQLYMALVIQLFFFFLPNLWYIFWEIKKILLTAWLRGNVEKRFFDPQNIGQKCSQRRCLVDPCVSIVNPTFSKLDTFYPYL